MTERPILFSDPMVRAILSGQKTQTRRVVKPQPDGIHAGIPFINGHGQGGTGTRDRFIRCPYGQPGDRLWVREAWRVHKDADHLPPRDLPRALTVRYEADGMPDAECGKYRPPMFMPRWACRLVLEIVSVRVERLQDISEEDALAEGVEVEEIEDSGTLSARFGENGRLYATQAFRDLWESINGAESWAANPWVWVVEFRRVKS